MVSSKVLVVICDEGACWAWSLGGFVVPDDGGEGEYRLEDRCHNTRFGASAVTFEIELALEGLEDRFGDLVEGSEEPLAASGRFCFCGGADEGHVGLVEVFLEVGASVSFVRHESLARSG